MLDSGYTVTKFATIIFSSLAVLALSMTASCLESGPKSGSETHWDPICSTNEECTAPLECICGDCLLPCEAQTQCENQAPATACSSRQVLIDHCYLLPSGASAACFPPCAEQSDCTIFGEGVSCLDGVCIRPE